MVASLGQWECSFATLALQMPFRVAGQRIWLFPVAAKAPALGLDKFNPVIEGLIQGVMLAIEAKADGKAGCS